MENKHILSGISVLIFFTFFLFKDSIISFCMDAYSIIIRLVSNKKIIVFIIIFILSILCLAFSFFIKSKIQNFEFYCKIDRSKLIDITHYEKSSNDEIIKLIEEYSKNSGEKNDNK